MKIESIDGVQLRECKSIPGDINKVIEALDEPKIEIKEVWIVPDKEFNPEVRVKYGYLIYPSYSFITTLKEEHIMQVDDVSIDPTDFQGIKTESHDKEKSAAEHPTEDKPIKRSSFDDMFDNTDNERNDGFLDDILPPIDEQTNELMYKSLVLDELKRKAELYGKLLENQYLTYRNLTAESLYKILTSAQHHKSITYMNACKCEHGVTSYIRMSELQKLFDFKTPSMGMENFAIDLGSTIIYLHMDTGRGGFDDVHFNRYRYNDIKKGEMKFFNKTNNYTPIDYTEWEERLSDKTVLVFGYAPKKVSESNLPLHGTEPPLIFLGSHECAALPTDKGFSLNLCYSYDLPV